MTVLAATLALLASDIAPKPARALAPRPALTYSAQHRRRARRQIAAARWYLRRHNATRPYRAWLATTRACESGGRYGIATGNGFYGAYQFTISSWHAVGGRGMPHQAPPLEQDYRAVRLLHVQGRGAWPVCG